MNLLREYIKTLLIEQEEEQSDLEKLQDIFISNGAQGAELGEIAVVILATHIVADVAELCSRMAIIDKGRILVETEPVAAIAALQGQIWRRLISKDQVAEFQAAHDIISTRLVLGRTAIRVRAASTPGEGFEAVEPDLEDVYFTTMRSSA